MNQPCAIALFLSLQVRAECEKAFDEAMEHWILRLGAFRKHMNPQALLASCGNHTHVAILRFKNQNELQSFKHSSEYRHFLGDIRPYLETNPHLDTICGLERWFTPPSSELRPPPEKWKMALVTWIGVCFTVYAVTLMLTPSTRHWPWFLKFITLNGGVVAGLTWVVMPVLSHVFAAWLFPRRANTM